MHFLIRFGIFQFQIYPRNVSRILLGRKNPIKKHRKVFFNIFNLFDFQKAGVTIKLLLKIIFFMNKNVIIGVLVCIVAVLGYITITGNSVLQQASSIQTQEGVNLSTASKQVAEFTKKDGGVIVKIADQEISEMVESASKIATIPVSNGGTTLRPYKCYVRLSNGGAYIYDYNSLYDHGSIWNLGDGWKCFAKN